MSKADRLQQIAEKICNDTRNPLHGNGKCVPGEGSPDAEIFFVGEAPGYHESQQGRPFVGRAGKLLDELLEENGLQREEVFIGNVLHWRPPDNRDPLPKEIEIEKPYLLEQIEVIDPKIIATISRFAMNIFLPDEKISRMHGRARRLESGRLIFPLYHPAAALRNGKIRASLEEDFAKLVKLYKLETGQAVENDTEMEVEKAEPKVGQESLFG